MKSDFTACGGCYTGGTIKQKDKGFKETSVGSQEIKFSVMKDRFDNSWKLHINTHVSWQTELIKLLVDHRPETHKWEYMS